MNTAAQIVLKMVGVYSQFTTYEDAGYIQTWSTGNNQPVQLCKFQTAFARNRKYLFEWWSESRHQRLKIITFEQSSHFDVSEGQEKNIEICDPSEGIAYALSFTSGAAVVMSHLLIDEFRAQVTAPVCREPMELLGVEPVEQE